MKRYFSLFVAAVLLAAPIVPDGQAQPALRAAVPSPTQTPNPSANAPLELTAACGHLDAPLCAAVLTRLTTRTTRTGIVLKQTTAADPAIAVCEGRIAAAIVPRDAIPPDCAAKADIVGRALFPWYGVLVVQAGAPIRHLDDMAAAEVPRRLLAPANDPTLANLIRAKPAWQTKIAIAEGDGDTALRRVIENSADAMFTVSALGGSVIARVLSLSTAVVFANIHPGAELFRFSDGQGHCLYRNVALDFGGKSPITTVSVEAVLLLGRGFRDARARGGPRAADALAGAIEQSQAGLLSDTKSPADWRPGTGACNDPPAKAASDRVGSRNPL